MAHEDCKHEWTSFLTRKSPTPGKKVNEGKITIREVNSKLKGKHATSTSDFDVTCTGNRTKISFTRDDNKNGKRISYKGDFTSDDSIHGSYTRTDLVSLAGGRSSKKAQAADSGDWDATKPPTLSTNKERAAKGSGKTAKNRTGTATKKSAKKAAKKRARKMEA